MDEDGKPDFDIVHRGQKIRIECKNVRNEIFKKPTPAFKVEIQKTRNSKDGSNTRSYRRDYFDVLAVCTFNQTKKWEFVFIKASDLEIVESQPEFLKIMQRVPTGIEGSWKKSLLEVL